MHDQLHSSATGPRSAKRCTTWLERLFMKRQCKTCTYNPRSRVAAALSVAAAMPIVPAIVPSVVAALFAEVVVTTLGLPLAFPRARAMTMTATFIASLSTPLSLRRPALRQRRWRTSTRRERRCSRRCCRRRPSWRTAAVAFGAPREVGVATPRAQPVLAIATAAAPAAVTVA
jgi:hypothetical protein